MCPNWQTTSTKTTSAIDTNPLFTFSDPTPTTKYTYPPATCKCNIPTETDIGLCSTKFIAVGGVRINSMSSWCGCESKKKVDFSTECGRLVCPNLKETTEWTTPTPCPVELCDWPKNTELGLCESINVGLVEGRTVPHFLADYCACGNQGTAMVDFVTGCDGSRICPNQAELITDSHDLPYDCPTALPHLPFFESCGVHTLTGSIQVDGKLEVSTRCTCNAPGNDLSYWQVPTVSGMRCGEYLCPNSAGVVKETAAPGLWPPITMKRGLQQDTSATAVMPLLAVTTDATPGSIPTAAGPTSASEV
jgi:hypothetical protein